MDSIYIYSLISMGGLGALLAAGLGFAAKTFYVERDQRTNQVDDVLPGVNCGACGYAGCSSFAEALVAGDAPINGCPVGGEKLAQLLGEIMGSTAVVGEKKIAQVLCAGGRKETRHPAEYRGIQSCRAAVMVSGGTKSCQYGCLGLGDCVTACPFGAIMISDNGLPVIDPEKCTACNKCVLACPREIITLVAQSKENHIRCSSCDPGKVVRKICEVGCIGCRLCVKTCPVDAITMENNLAMIDYSNCINCGLCADKCPTGAIEFNGSKITEIEITDKCVGCTRCVKACPVAAISGELKSRHVIAQDKCIKCGICYEACKVKGAISVQYLD